MPLNPVSALEWKGIVLSGENQPNEIGTGAAFGPENKHLAGPLPLSGFETVNFPAAKLQGFYFVWDLRPFHDTTRTTC